jgi:hypothetical protein
LGCADVHSRLKIIKMATVPMVTMNVHQIFFVFYCNETSLELSLRCVEVHSGLKIFKLATLPMITLKVQKIKFKQVGGIYAHLFLNGCPKNVY